MSLTNEVVLSKTIMVMSAARKGFSKEDVRSTIKFPVLLGKTATQSYKLLAQAHGPECLTYETVRTWFKRFSADRTSVNDGPRAGRPTFATTPGMMKKVDDPITTDRRRTSRQVAEKLSISQERAYHILTKKKLNKRKTSAKWVPHLLT